ncbi:uncharacterized protein PHALS_07974 [Plasmopara halstedii]|uniref:Uncharacterized protein n=1 Tax=Plasmopara halstedii TaxID=4781 RepID=A0A0P1B8I2_PLAHL|nr:uncharacterized protein PHALS_07974 [Plasmopara halstedii]CEG50250.1 hypothetical protein PHALS_07974 [Plasmopara halstedii]|eukprot:XP_024586619.1 hypothetical protein PHALS_07974 [Plasmopara halstedii]
MKPTSSNAKIENGISHVIDKPVGSQSLVVDKMLKVVWGKCSASSLASTCVCVARKCLIDNMLACLLLFDAIVYTRVIHASSRADITSLR